MADKASPDSPRALSLPNFRGTRPANYLTGTFREAFLPGGFLQCSTSGTSPVTSPAINSTPRAVEPGASTSSNTGKFISNCERLENIAISGTPIASHLLPGSNSPSPIFRNTRLAKKKKKRNSTGNNSKIPLHTSKIDTPVSGTPKTTANVTTASKLTPGKLFSHAAATAVSSVASSSPKSSLGNLTSLGKLTQNSSPTSRFSPPTSTVDTPLASIPTTSAGSYSYSMRILNETRELLENSNESNSSDYWLTSPIKGGLFSPAGNADLAALTYTCPVRILSDSSPPSSAEFYRSAPEPRHCQSPRANLDQIIASSGSPVAPTTQSNSSPTGSNIRLTGSSPTTGVLHNTIVTTSPQANTSGFSPQRSSPSSVPASVRTSPTTNDCLVLNDDSPLSTVSSHRDINNSIGSPPGVTSSTRLNQARDSNLALSTATDVISEFPGYTVRNNCNLEFVFPIVGPLACTETSCIFLSSADSWYSKKHSLIRHLEQYHNLTNLTQVKWCSICQRTFSSAPATHSCLKNIPYCPPDYSRDDLPFKCDRCNFAAPSKWGIRNHMLKHKRDDQRNKNRSSNTTTNNRTSDSPQVDSPPSNGPSQLSYNSQHESQLCLSTGGTSQHACDDIHLTSDPTITTAEENENFDEFVLDPDSPSPSDPFLERFKDILVNFSTDKWKNFEDLLDDFIAFSQKHVGLPPPREFRAPNQTSPQNDPSTIQRLYRRNRRRAIRVINNETISQCNVDPAALADKFYSSPCSSPDINVFSSVNPAPCNVDSSPFTYSEVLQKLRTCENTAPGSDRLTYNHLRGVDTEAKVLALIFNICLKAKMIPQAWKHSRTIFIPKNGDPALPESWRPIALSCTMYKLFAGLLTKRLNNWIEVNSVLSHCQKGFRPFDGTLENNFLIQHRLQEARRLKKDLLFILIDIQNAFGSIPHPTIFAALQAAGVGGIFLDLIKDMYDENFASLITSHGLSDPTKISVGVKQGCPLSGPIFNLVINVALERIQNNRDKYHILGYADDLVIMEDTPDALQHSINILLDTISKLGLTLNPVKCKSVHISQRCSTCLPTVFQANGTAIPYLSNFEPAAYLGKPIGFNIFSDDQKLENFISKGENIINSHLAPWHKFDAMKSFFYPSLNYAMRTDQFGKESWKQLDNHLRPYFKKLLSLPSRAANEYLYGQTNDGLFGVPLVAEDSDIARIDTAFKLLMSIDPRVKICAWEDLKTCVGDRIPDPTKADIADFLSNNRYGSTSNRLSSVWSHARSASGRLGVSWHITDDFKVSITIGDTTVTDRRKVFKSLRLHLRSLRSETLSKKPHQGKTFHSFSKSKCSSHFNRTGDFLRFANWRFIHQARLGVVKLNGYSHDLGSSKLCRNCNRHDETLPHVINHCLPAMQKITARHNRIVNRIKDAALKCPFSTWNLYSENQTVGPNRLKPDLVLYNNKDEALIIDVTVPFENGPDAFSNARRAKEEKYASLIPHLKGRFKSVRICAIVIGSLGSWDRDNDKYLTKLCSRKYLSLMRKLMVSDTVRASRDIFIEHITGVPQTDTRSRYGRKKLSSNNSTTEHRMTDGSSIPTT